MTSEWHTAAPQASPHLAHLHAQLPPKDSAHAPPDPPTPSTVAMQPLVFGASDGHPLHGHWFDPQHRAPQAIAVIAPATGVPQRYYHAFARWQAQRGYRVLCFDYRGMGAHRAATGRTGMREWVRHDLSGALQAACAGCTEHGHALPVLWVGHSLGVMARRWCKAWSGSMPRSRWVRNSGTGRCGRSVGTAR
ncbi:serine aminopeptidase domain-containing protein [Hydrogenophaga sp.]|uniref:serine aminopeptidase domain-containing protein n=1 Tax=Hydrogenophaga sp. TaxID=1904254 RepID=UPI003F6BEA2C